MCNCDDCNICDLVPFQITYKSNILGFGDYKLTDIFINNDDIDYYLICTKYPKNWKSFLTETIIKFVRSSIDIFAEPKNMESFGMGPQGVAGGALALMVGLRAKQGD